MLSEGENAPDFQASGIKGVSRSQFRLSNRTKKNNFVLLLFYPFDFSPVCTRELCMLRDSEWFTFVDELDVWGISSDSTYAHRAFADEYNIQFPLLSDDGAEIASRYGVKYDWWDGHLDVPKRAVFLIDTDQTVAYAWKTDDAYNQPDFWVLNNAIDAVSNHSLTSEFTPDNSLEDIESEDIESEELTENRFR